MLKRLLGLLALKLAPERAGMTFFKHKLKVAGIPRGRVPSAAIEEMVKADLERARTIASFAAHLPGMADKSDWISNFLSNMEASVSVLSSILEGDKGSLTDNPSMQAIVKKYAIQVVES